MIYKGYEAIVEYDEDAKILHGEVLNLKDVITFEADCTADLEHAFKDSVDDYLEFCKERGQSPEKPFSGRIVVRMPPELHREATTAAKKKKESINSLIIEALQTYVMKL